MKRIRVIALLVAFVLLCGCIAQASTSFQTFSTQEAVSIAGPPIDLVTQLPISAKLAGQEKQVYPHRAVINSEQWDRSYLFSNPPVILKTSEKPTLVLSFPDNSTGKVDALNAKGELITSTIINSNSITLQLADLEGDYTFKVNLETVKAVTYKQEYDFYVSYKKIISSSQATDPGKQSEMKVTSYEAISPGGMIIVKVEGYSGNLPLYAKFLNVENRTFPLYSSAKSKIGFVAISSLTNKPGKLQIYASKDSKSGGELIATHTILVSSKSFKRQDLTVEPGSAMESAGSSDNLASDKKIIAEVTNAPSDELFCEGSFIQPVEGRISTQFGQMRYTNGEFTSSHSGLDIAAAEGTPVLAANNAKVVFAGEMKFYGNTVILDHGMGLFTFYNHMCVLNTKAGQMVTKGEKIGEVGSTGYATGPHLHWNVWIQNVSVDPALFTNDKSIISDMIRMMRE